MSATDELRRLLDERGVPYETNDDMGASETRWNGFTAYQLTPNAKLVMHPTPEQAIAATLGGGKLTAEQVHKAVSGNRNITDNRFYCDWQAIADELNATLGRGTGEWVLEHSGTLYDKWRCSKCGYLFVEPRCDQGYTDLDPNFCPKCGVDFREVVSE